MDERKDLFGTVEGGLAPRGGRIRYQMRPATEGGHLMAFTERGHLIGTEEQALWLSARGIDPEYADESSVVCSVGFCTRNGKWWGWHRRTAKSFGVSDVAAWGKPETTPTLTPEQLANGGKDPCVPVGFTAKTLDDARRMAVAFARASGAR